MKKFLLLIFALIIFSDSQTNAQVTKVLSIGPSIAYKAGVSAINTPLGRKNGVSFNKIPDFGLSTYFPLSKTENIGLQLDIAYSQYSYKMISAHDSKKEYNFHHSYIAVNPNFYFKGMLFGFAALIASNSKNENSDLKNNILKTSFALNLGYEYPIYVDDSGELNIFINGGYFLNGVYKNFVKNDPMKEILPADEKVTGIHNPRVASLQLGFNFLFDLKKKPKAEIVDDLYE